MRKYFCYIILALSCLSCGPRALERAGIPIVWGMRINEFSDFQQLATNLGYLNADNDRQLLIEMPLRADSMGLPIVPVEIPAASIALLGEWKGDLSIAFCNTNEAELFPIGKPADLAAWFGALQEAIADQLKLFKSVAIKRVIIGGNLLQVHDADAEWLALLQSLRQQHPKTLFSVGGKPTLFENSALSKLSDELAIDYPPMAGDELKPMSRAENQGIAALVSALHQPIFIYRANILGEDQLIQLKNRLRFWPDGILINGICVNTLYPAIPAADDHTYYGLKDNPEVLDYLKAYRQLSAE